MTANERRISVRDKYRTILGRNKYSQAKRSYVNTKYKDGNYYSDCSSSVCWALKAAGYPITYGGSSLPSTVGIYNSKDVVEVPVKINAKGEIANPEVLRIADGLLFAGTDSSRKGSGYVGHVEMVGEISSTGKITIYGHGSGTPRKTEMQAYLRKRRSSVTSTALGHKGLIKVVRRIQDDAASAPKPSISGPSVTVQNCKSCNLRLGPGTNYKSVGTAKSGDVFAAPATAGWISVKMADSVCWISEKYVKSGVITGKSVNVRTGPGTSYKSVAIMKKDEAVVPVSADTWVPVVHDGAVRWISKKYVK